jgi:iron-sulfur cluster assembly protein
MAYSGVRLFAGKGFKGFVEERGCVILWGGERKMIHLTPAAVERVKLLMQKEHQAKALRVGVRGGGCSGLTYVLSLDADAPKEGDTVSEEAGVKIYMDLKSSLYIDETVIDYKEDVMTGGFEFHNPNAKKSCGCGTSFSAE